MKPIILIVFAGLLLLLVAVIPWPLPTFGLAATQPADVNYGQRLFVAKGCVGCHYHAAVSSERISHFDAPNLTDYQADPEYVRSWLRDPKAIRPATVMPDLNLSESEIEALVAFINSDGNPVAP